MIAERRQDVAGLKGRVRSSGEDPALGGVYFSTSLDRTTGTISVKTEENRDD